MTFAAVLGPLDAAVIVLLLAVVVVALWRGRGLRVSAGPVSAEIEAVREIATAARDHAETAAKEATAANRAVNHQPATAPTLVRRVEGIERDVKDIKQRLDEGAAWFVQIRQELGLEVEP